MIFTITLYILVLGVDNGHIVQMRRIEAKNKKTELMKSSRRQGSQARSHKYTLLDQNTSFHSFIHSIRYSQPVLTTYLYIGNRRVSSQGAYSPWERQIATK